MRVALVALLVAVGSTEGGAQRLDDLIVGVGLSHAGVLRGDRDARATQSPPAPGHHHDYFLDRVIWSTALGALIALPTGFLSMSSYSATPLWVGGAAALTAIAVNTASIAGPGNRCTFDVRLVDAAIGALAGAGVSAAIASTMKETNREGARAAIAGTGAVLAAPVGSALAVRHCDAVAPKPTVRDSSGFDGGLMLRRTLKSTTFGLAVLAPFALVAWDQQQGDPALTAAAFSFYGFGVARVTSSMVKPGNRCSGERRFGRAVLGTAAGLGAAALIAPTLATSNRNGPRSVLAGTTMVFAAPVGAGLLVAGCD